MKKIFTNVIILGFLIFGFIEQTFSQSVLASSDPYYICYEGSSQLDADPSGITGNLTYSWSPTTGLDDPTISDPIASNLTTTIIYTVDVTGNNGTYSDTTIVNVYDEFMASIAADQTICYNTVPDLLTSTVIGGDETYTYQWQDSPEGTAWTDISGATSDTLQPPNLITTTYYHLIVDDETCTPVTTDSVIITVYNELLASIASDQTICYNTAPDLLTSTASGGDGTYTYQWQDSPDGSSWTDITGATSATFQPPALPSTTYYQLIVDDEFCTSVITNSITINVYNELLASIGTDQTICYNTAPNPLTSNVSGGDGNYTYQWWIYDGSNWSIIPSATNPSYQPGILTVDTDYQLTINDGADCGPIITNTVTITVYDELLASIASDQTICYNTAPDLLTSTASGGDGTYTYQWQDSPNGISWTDISGATSDTYQPPTLPNTTYYQLIVDDETCTPVTTNSAIITVYDELLASISSDQSICYNTAPDPLNSTVTGGDETYTYQWQDSPDGSAWTDISGATSETYQPPTLTATTHYQLIVDDETCTPVTSNSVTKTVYTDLLASIGSDEIICFNTVPGLLNSTVSGGDETYTYQWQDSPDGSAWADIPGATSDTYQPPALTAITYYQLIVDDETCIPVTTNPLTIIVYDQFDIGAISGGNTPICSGEDGGTLQANPTGGSESYTIDWYDGDDNYLASGTTYPAGNLTETTSYYYHVLDSDDCGDENSQQVTILVNPSVTASISISVSKNPTCDNEVVIFSISDTLNGGNGPDFEWFLNGGSQSSGDSWTSIVSDNDEVYVQMNSNAECVSNNPADSDPITMTVNASPVLLNSGNLVPKPLDNPVVLICVDSTETNTYRWFENGVEIPSADEQFYYPRKYDLTFNYNSEYYVMIENDFCFSNSNPYIYAFDKSALFEESEVFIVYPNPNKGNFSLVLNEEIVPENFETGTIRILDVTGKIVFKEKFSEMEQNIELSGIQKGLYFLEVMISENQHQIRKLIIE